jgi:hypothetical protein
MSKTSSKKRRYKRYKSEVKKEVKIEQAKYSKMTSERLNFPTNNFFKIHFPISQIQNKDKTKEYKFLKEWIYQKKILREL